MPDWTDRNNEDLPNRNRSDPQGSEKSGGTDIWGIVSAGKTSGGNSDSRAARGGGDAVSELLAKKRAAMAAMPSQMRTDSDDNIIGLSEENKRDLGRKDSDSGGSVNDNAGNSGGGKAPLTVYEALMQRKREAMAAMPSQMRTDSDDNIIGSSGENKSGQEPREHVFDPHTKAGNVSGEAYGDDSSDKENVVGSDSGSRVSGERRDIRGGYSSTKVFDRSVSRQDSEKARSDDRKNDFRQESADNRDYGLGSVGSAAQRKDFVSGGDVRRESEDDNRHERKGNGDNYGAIVEGTYGSKVAEEMESRSDQITDGVFGFKSSSSGRFDSGSGNSSGRFGSNNNDNPRRNPDSGRFNSNNYDNQRRADSFGKANDAQRNRSAAEEPKPSRPVFSRDAFGMGDRPDEKSFSRSAEKKEPEKPAAKPAQPTGDERIRIDNVSVPDFTDDEKRRIDLKFGKGAPAVRKREEPKNKKSAKRNYGETSLYPERRVGEERKELSRKDAADLLYSSGKIVRKEAEPEYTGLFPPAKESEKPQIDRDTAVQTLFIDENGNDVRRFESKTVERRSLEEAFGPAEDKKKKAEQQKVKDYILGGIPGYKSAAQPEDAEEDSFVKAADRLYPQRNRGGNFGERKEAPVNSAPKSRLEAVLGGPPDYSSGKDKAPQKTKGKRTYSKEEILRTQAEIQADKAAKDANSPSYKRVLHNMLGDEIGKGPQEDRLPEVGEHNDETLRRDYDSLVGQNIDGLRKEYAEEGIEIKKRSDSVRNYKPVKVLYGNKLNLLSALLSAAAVLLGLFFTFVIADSSVKNYDPSGLVYCALAECAILVVVSVVTVVRPNKKMAVSEKPSASIWIYLVVTVLLGIVILIFDTLLMPVDFNDPSELTNAVIGPIIVALGIFALGGFRCLLYGKFVK